MGALSGALLIGGGVGIPPMVFLADTLRELVDEYCGGMAEGHELYAYLPGGASGGIFPESLADVPLDFDTLQPHGGFIGSAAVIVLGQHDKARDAALNMMRFFAHESCGFCTPCRVGTELVVRQMDKLQRGYGSSADIQVLYELDKLMHGATHCGLGAGAVTMQWMNGTSAAVPQDAFFSLPVAIVLPPRGYDWVALS